MDETQDITEDTGTEASDVVEEENTNTEEPGNDEENPDTSDEGEEQTPETGNDETGNGDDTTGDGTEEGNDSGGDVPPTAGFFYVGESELKYFLRLSNELYDKKYMSLFKIPAVAKRALRADKLGHSVLINGQLFDGTQNITFDEYAKKEEVVAKINCTGDGTVVALNSEGKIEDEYINESSIVNMAIDPVKGLGANLVDSIADNDKRFGDARIQVVNDESASIVSGPMHMKQTEIVVQDDETPSLVVVEGSQINNCCAPPIEVLKDEGGSKSGTLNYLTLNYNLEDSDLEIAENSIKLSTKKIPLLIDKEHQSETLDITESNYSEYEYAWAHSDPFEVEEGFTVYRWYAKPLTPEILSNGISSIELSVPGAEAHYGVFIGNDVYYVNDDKLVNGATLSGENDDMTAYMTIFKGSPNLPITKEMIMDDESIPKDKDIVIALFSAEDDILTPFSMSYRPGHKEHCIAAPDRSFDSFNVNAIEGFVPQYDCGEENQITFAVMLIDDEGQKSYVTWNDTNQAWDEISAENVASSGVSIENLSNIPSNAWKFKDNRFTLIYVLTQNNMSSACEVQETQVFYTSRPILKKAIHGIDYDYAYSDGSIVVSLNTAGRFLINYPTAST